MSNDNEGKPARRYYSDILNNFFNYPVKNEEYTIDLKKKLIAIKIDDALIIKKLGKREFAKLCKVSPSIVTKWISGNHNFTIETLFLIEQKLDIKLINMS